MRIPGAWRIENAAHTIRLLGKATSGYRQFLRTGTTPTEAYATMRKLYCCTNGRYNDFMASLSGLCHPPRKRAIANGVLGDLNKESIGRIAGQIRRHGYYVFERKLPANMQQALVEFSLRTPAKPLMISKYETLTNFNFERLADCVYDRNNIVSARYDFDQQIVAEQPVVQGLLTDDSILSIARAYLGAEPINDLIAMWWSTAYMHGRASSAAAQNFHFDMDRIKFLKFFFYLSNVGPENGPHCYIRNSHNRKPVALLKDGRISDEEIFRHYSEEQIVEITGARGTILAADTRGFHKGMPPLSGERLLLQIEFATSLFGAEYQTIKVNNKFTNDFRRFAAQHPRIFANYDL